MLSVAGGDTWRLSYLDLITQQQLFYDQLITTPLSNLLSEIQKFLNEKVKKALTFKVVVVVVVFLHGAVSD